MYIVQRLAILAMSTSQINIPGESLDGEAAPLYASAVVRLLALQPPIHPSSQTPSTNITEALSMFISSERFQLISSESLPRYSLHHLLAALVRYHG